jgi:hypothetical protein
VVFTVLTAVIIFLALPKAHQNELVSGLQWKEQNLTVQSQPCTSVVHSPLHQEQKITDLRMPVEILPKNWISQNEIMIQALFRCLEVSECGLNQTKGAFCTSIIEQVNR